MSLREHAISQTTMEPLVLHEEIDGRKKLFLQQAGIPNHFFWHYSHMTLTWLWQMGEKMPDLSLCWTFISQVSKQHIFSCLDCFFIWSYSCGIRWTHLDTITPYDLTMNCNILCWTFCMFMIQGSYFKVYYNLQKCSFHSPTVSHIAYASVCRMEMCSYLLLL